MRITSHFSFNIAWLSPKFVYDAFIAKNPIKGVPTPYKYNQQHLETITVPPLPFSPTHTLFLVNVISQNESQSPIH